MSRLQEFIEMSANGDSPMRAAYALDLTQPPALEQGSKWRLVENFKPGDEILPANRERGYCVQSREMGIVIRV